jgi:hypothetical protein
MDEPIYTALHIRKQILKERIRLFLLAKVKCSVANHATRLQSGISAPLTPQSDTGHDSKTFVFSSHLQFLVTSSCLMSSSHKISKFSRFPYYLQHFLIYINTHKYKCMLNLSYNPQFDSPDDLHLVPGMCKGPSLRFYVKTENMICPAM